MAAWCGVWGGERARAFFSFRFVFACPDPPVRARLFFSPSFPPTPTYPMDARECESRLKQMTAGVFVCVRACVGARRESFERERIFCVCGFSLLVFCVLLLSLLHKQGGWGGGERARARVPAQATHSTRNEGREERERERAWGAARTRRPPPTHPVAPLFPPLEKGGHTGHPSPPRQTRPTIPPFTPACTRPRWAPRTTPHCTPSWAPPGRAGPSSCATRPTGRPCTGRPRRTRTPPQ